MSQDYLKSVKTIIAQNGSCDEPIRVVCYKCPFNKLTCFGGVDKLARAKKYLANDNMKNKEKE